MAAAEKAALLLSQSPLPLRELFGINKYIKFIDDLTVFHLYGTDLGNTAGAVGKSRGFDIKENTIFFL